MRAAVEPVSGDRCRVRVELRRPELDPCVGTAEGSCAGPDALRTAAKAAAEALRLTLEGAAASLRIRGVGLVDAFGQPAVMVSLRAQYQGETRSLLGLCPHSGDPARAAALAVLNATNRFLEVG